MKKKILSFLTMVCMVVALLSANITTISAASSYNSLYGDYLYYQYGSYYNIEITDCDESATEIVIPAKISNRRVTTISYNAFQNCSKLTSITIPNSITHVYSYAFHLCSNLKRVNISDIDAWCSIDFSNYSSNPLYYSRKLYLNNEIVTKLAPSSGVSKIGTYAFYMCEDLTSVTLSDSVTCIGDNAFLGCKNLKNVYYNGTKAEWDNITIGSSNYCLTNAKRTYFAYINIFDKDENKVIDTTQNMGEKINTSNITVPNGYMLKLYKDKEMTDEYSIDMPISKNLNLYYNIEKINELKITGANSADIGQKGITESITLATGKTAKYFVANIKYSNDLSLSEVKSEVFDIEKDEYADNGQKYLSLTCTYKNDGNMPINTTLNAFDLVFDVSESATANEKLTIEFVNDETLLADDNGNTYPFDDLGKAEIKVNPTLVSNITINGADEIDKATQYTAIIIPENATNKEVEWSVDNSEIATISTDGTLTPIKIGAVKITATAKDGSDIYGEKSVNVKVYAEITAFSANVGVWNKAFTPTEREYTIYVPKNTSSIKLTATHSGTLKYGNNTFYSGRAKQVSLIGDETVLTLTYSQTDYTDSEYKITIVKFEGTKTTVSEDGTIFTVKPINIANGNTVILALYNGNSFVGMEEPQKYEGDPLTFTTNKSYTNAKIMVWDSLDGMQPQCEAEILNAKID